jgi:predicted nucleotidyltransferase
MASYIEVRNYLQKKNDRQKAKRLTLWQEAYQDAQSIVEMIIQKYKPKQIIQWGSILEPAHFSEISDIDLAVVGLDPIVFMRLLADAEAMTSFPLDIVQFESLHPSFQKIILMKGQVIYGK